MKEKISRNPGSGKHADEIKKEVKNSDMFKLRDNGKEIGIIDTNKTFVNRFTDEQIKLLNDDSYPGVTIDQKDGFITSVIVNIKGAPYGHNIAFDAFKGKPISANILNEISDRAINIFTEFLDALHSKDSPENLEEKKELLGRAYNLQKKLGDLKSNIVNHPSYNASEKLQKAVQRLEKHEQNLEAKVKPDEELKMGQLNKIEKVLEDVRSQSLLEIKRFAEKVGENMQNKIADSKMFRVREGDIYAHSISTDLAFANLFTDEQKKQINDDQFPQVTVEQSGGVIESVIIQMKGAPFGHDPRFNEFKGVAVTPETLNSVSDMAEKLMKDLLNNEEARKKQEVLSKVLYRAQILETEVHNLQKKIAFHPQFDSSETLQNLSVLLGRYEKQLNTNVQSGEGLSDSYLRGVERMLQQVRMQFAAEDYKANALRADRLVIDDIEHTIPIRAIHGGRDTMISMRGIVKYETNWHTRHYEKYGYVSYLQALTKELGDTAFFRPDEAMREKAVLQDAVKAVSLRLTQIATILERMPEDPKHPSREREELKALFLKESNELAHMLIGVHELSHEGLYNPQIAARVGEQIVRNMSLDEGIAWAKKMDNKIGYWQSAGQRQAAMALFAGIRNGIMAKYEQESATAITKSDKEHYQRKALEISRLFRSQDTVKTRSKSMLHADITHDRLRYAGTDHEYSLAMTKKALNFEDLAFRHMTLTLGTQDPLNNEVSKEWPKVQKKLQARIGEEGMKKLQSTPAYPKMIALIEQNPTSLAESIGRYHVFLQLKQLADGSAMNTGTMQEDIKKRLEPYIKDSAEKFGSFLELHHTEIASGQKSAGATMFNAVQREALAQLADMQGYGYFDFSDTTWSYVYMAGKVTSMIASGILIGIATGGMSLPAQMASVGITMTATGAVMEGKSVDSLEEGISVYGTDFAVSAFGTGLGRLLGSARYAMQLRNANPAGLTARQIFKEAMSKGGMAKLGQYYDDALGLGTRLAGAATEGVADTAISSWVDTQLTPGTTFVGNLLNNAVFLGIPFGMEFRRDVLRGLRLTSPQQFKNVHRISGKITSEIENLRNLCGTDIDAESIYKASSEDLQAVLGGKNITPSKISDIEESIGRLKNLEGQRQQLFGDMDRIVQNRLNVMNMEFDETPEGRRARVQKGLELLRFEGMTKDANGNKIDFNNPDQKYGKAILDAHDIEPPYTKAKLARKRKILKQIFTDDQVDTLIRTRIAGVHLTANYSSTPPPPSRSRSAPPAPPKRPNRVSKKPDNQLAKDIIGKLEARWGGRINENDGFESTFLRGAGLTDAEMAQAQEAGILVRDNGVYKINKNYLNGAAKKTPPAPPKRPNRVSKKPDNQLAKDIIGKLEARWGGRINENDGFESTFLRGAGLTDAEMAQAQEAGILVRDNGVYKINKNYLNGAAKKTPPAPPKRPNRVSKKPDNQLAKDIIGKLEARWGGRINENDGFESTFLRGAGLTDAEMAQAQEAGILVRDNGVYKINKNYLNGAAKKTPPAPPKRPNRVSKKPDNQLAKDIIGKLEARWGGRINENDGFESTFLRGAGLTDAEMAQAQEAGILVRDNGVYKINKNYLNGAAKKTPPAPPKRPNRVSKKPDNQLAKDIIGKLEARWGGRINENDGFESTFLRGAGLTDAEMAQAQEAGILVRDNGVYKINKNYLNGAAKKTPPAPPKRPNRVSKKPDNQLAKDIIGKLEARWGGRINENDGFESTFLRGAGLTDAEMAQAQEAGILVRDNGVYKINKNYLNGAAKKTPPAPPKRPNRVSKKPDNQLAKDIIGKLEARWGGRINENDGFESTFLRGAGLTDAEMAQAQEAGILVRDNGVYKINKNYLNGAAKKTPPAPPKRPNRVSKKPDNQLAKDIIGKLEARWGGRINENDGFESTFLRGAGLTDAEMAQAQEAGILVRDNGVYKINKNYLNGAAKKTPPAPPKRPNRVSKKPDNQLAKDIIGKLEARWGGRINENDGFESTFLRGAGLTDAEMAQAQEAGILVRDNGVYKINKNYLNGAAKKTPPAPPKRPNRVSKKPDNQLAKDIIGKLEARWGGRINENDGFESTFLRGAGLTDAEMAQAQEAGILVRDNGVYKINKNYLNGAAKKTPPAPPKRPNRVSKKPDNQLAKDIIGKLEARWGGRINENDGFESTFLRGAGLTDAEMAQAQEAGILVRDNGVYKINKNYLNGAISEG